jgi:hypothetical protein
MAQINVEPKRNKNWWIWVVVVAAILFIWWLFMRDNQEMNRVTPMSDSTLMEDTVTPMPDTERGNDTATMSDTIVPGPY